MTTPPPHALRHTLPRPGPLWGDAPLRPAQDLAPPWRGLAWRHGMAHCRHVASLSQQHAETGSTLTASARLAKAAALRTRLRRDGLTPDSTAQALGLCAAQARIALGLTPRPSQLWAAAALLDNRMAEMATGEGKTLAIALAASVAALAGMPVHVVTANDYLAARDAATLAPLAQALGLRVTALTSQADDEAKRQAYAHDIVYATAKELAFDFLRDRQATAQTSELELLASRLAGTERARPVMRGLCMALMDEADSILLDEAEVPLILSRSAPQTARRAFLWQALALARQLAPERDFQLHAADRVATLTAAGEDRLAALAQGLGGPWQRPRYRREAVVVALAGLHLCLRDTHYIVRNEAIELLDPVTGRVAVGRVWSRGLHTVVALKENLDPPHDTDTVAQTTFQRFFQRYWRLCGISGTLWEARTELCQIYGARVLRIPLHRPCRRIEAPMRQFANTNTRFQAACTRVAQLSQAGRPVLVGTDSVADSQQLSALLRAAGISHRVLNALSDADEAPIVAQAGRAGAVTVATRLAGRGTDIELDEAARQAGGLHVLSCQDNPSRRLDRQLAGRAGRHGDPGSSETWVVTTQATQLPPQNADSPPWTTLTSPPLLSRLATLRRRWAQRREEQRRTALRRQLLEHDLEWERQLAFAGCSA